MYRISKSLRTGLKPFKAFLHKTHENLLFLSSEGWKPYSRLILDGDNAGWVLDWEMREIGTIAQHLGIQLASPRWRNVSVPLSIFFANQFFLLNDDWLHLRHRIGFAYFHGLPGTGEPLFDKIHQSLQRHHTRITRIQVSHTQMKNVVLETGIEPSKVFQIPIGVNLHFFPYRNDELKYAARQKLNIPQSAFVIGSFQKDGVGWNEGLEPKLIKGPDVLLAAIRKLKTRIPEIYVLLSGPARGYVKAGLETMQIPYSHFYLDDYSQIGNLFQALDLYLIAARQEGGPKAVLESMASGVPIISTRVGQASDLIQHGQNGWLAEVGNSDEIANLALYVHDLSASTLAQVLGYGRITAENNSYPAQIPLWTNFMKGFVAWNS